MVPYVGVGVGGTCKLSNVKIENFFGSFEKMYYLCKWEACPQCAEAVRRHQLSLVTPISMAHLFFLRMSVFYLVSWYFISQVYENPSALLILAHIITYVRVYVCVPII